MGQIRCRTVALSTLFVGCLLNVGCREAVQAPAAVEATSTSRHAEKTAEEEARVQQLERAWSGAYARKDYGWYERHVAEDYRTVLSDGRVLTRAEVIDYMRKSPAPKQISTDQADVRVYDDVAVALVTQSYVGASGKRGRLRMTDVWIRGAGGIWQVVHSQEALLPAE